MSTRPRAKVNTRVGTVLVVDDEDSVRFGIRSFLSSHGFEVEEAGDCRGAEDVAGLRALDAAIVDYRLPDGTALDLLRRLKSTDPSLPIIVLTAHASIDLAVSAMREGAEHFLTKPVELAALLSILGRVLDQRRARRLEVAGLTRDARSFVDPFQGTSRAIRELAEHARRVVATDSTVLIRGETGSGKGVLARWLHSHGPRADEPFVDLNCGGLSREFLETELFGHEKGAFTGAVGSKVGLLEVAHRGTVFLDEIGDMDTQVQRQVLKVLEEKRFRRLGNVRDHLVDVRLISATHQDLAKLIRERAFREDLYFRISAIPLSVPPLLERVEDIPVIADSLLRRIAPEIGRGEVGLADSATAALGEYSWPGNIREMRNVLERAVLVADSDRLEAGHLRFEFAAHGSGGDDDASLTLAEVERRHIERVLKDEKGNVTAAARRLGVPKSSLYQRIKKSRSADGS